MHPLFFYQQLNFIMQGNSLSTQKASHYTYRFVFIIRSNIILTGTVQRDYLEHRSCTQYPQDQLVFLFVWALDILAQL